MDTNNSVLMCKCQIYHRIDETRLAQLIEALHAAGISLTIADDLCYEAVHRPERLRAADVVIGCHVRTLAALCTYAGVEKLPQTFDINVDIDALIEKLGQIAAVPVDEPTHITAPKEWVAWYPVVDQDRCVDCGKCADFCMFGVYHVEDKKVTVVKPSGCKTDCPACARMCPANAIIFPKSPEANLNGSLDHVVKPDPDQTASLRARLQARRAARLFREDET